MPPMTPAIPTAVASPSAAARADELSRCASELVACGSIEMSAHRLADVARIAAILPVGTRVFVNHLPRHSLRETLAALMAVRQAGLEPVPHLAARRLASRAEARSLVESAVREAGVQKVLVIGGDTRTPEGPYPDAIALLREGLFAEHGIAEVGLSGYPEGHPLISTERCAEALDEKLALASAQGLGAFVVTQFSFAPRRIIDFCAQLGRHAPNVPVFVGIAGPADPISLIRYAQRCGVGASLRALQTRGLDAVRLGTRTNPDEQLRALAQHCCPPQACNVVGTHLYSFGGVETTARWMHGWITTRGQRS